MLEKITFIYNHTEDRICHERYDAFIAEHKTVWGRTSNIKNIINIKNIDFDVDIKEISEAYEKVFGPAHFCVTGYVVTTPFSMIDDGDVFNEAQSKLFYSIYNLFGYPPSIVIAHELFHIYFEKYTKRNIPDYATAKEYFTVIMNDIFDKEVSKGYPEHQEIRAEILNVWKTTKSIDETIKVLSK